MNNIKLYEQLKPEILQIISKIPLDKNYTDITEWLSGVLKSNDDFDYVECTIEITTRKKGRIISVYNQENIKNGIGGLLNCLTNLM